MNYPGEELKKGEVVDSLAATIRQRIVAPTREWLARIDWQNRELKERLARAEQALLCTKKQILALFGALALIAGCLGYLFYRILP